MEVTASTIGISSGNEKLNMPPFAVDIVAGQGNGDVTDAVIALRGRILNDTSAQSVAEVFFVACSWEEAETVSVALDQWSEALAESGGDMNDEIETVRHLAKRYRLVPSPPASEKRKRTLVVTYEESDVKRDFSFIDSTIERVVACLSGVAEAEFYDE